MMSFNKLGFKLAILIMVPIYFCISSDSRNKVNEEMYLSSWITINRPFPKIIDFNHDGEAVIKVIPNSTIIGWKRIKDVIGSRTNLNPFLPNGKKGQNSNKWESNHIANLIRIYIENTYENLKRPNKLKILTNCNDSTSLCRFLACPNIKDHCLVCEVKTNDDSNNSTKCDKVSTKFLITHRYSVTQQEATP